VNRPRAKHRNLGLLLLAAAAPALAQWAEVPVLRPRVLAEIPHDTAAFTQGLVWLGGKMFESAGLYGKSALREVNPLTGKLVRSVRLPGRYFAEGLAWFGGEFVQITWKEGEALRWPRSPWPASAASLRRFRYAGEGWGLATLGEGKSTALWMSNGSDTLVRRDAAFRVVARVPVHREGRPVDRLNELEGARGKIIANIWYSDTLVVIDPRDGRVVALVDGSALAARSGRRADDVMNGVAWDPARDEFYLTGKNWPKMYRVKIDGF
jgi:glutamine cyclotransferase